MADVSSFAVTRPDPAARPVATALAGWVRLEHEGVPVWVAPAAPDWVVPNRRADLVLGELAGGASPAEVAARCAERWGVAAEQAWDEVQRTLARMPAVPPRLHCNRADLLRLGCLRECWLHVSNRCNLACTHCMFSSSPQQSLELTTARLLERVAEARSLGCRLFYLTGGEPMIHPGFVALCREILSQAETHLVILSNALAVPRLEDELTTLPRARVHFQVSLDCPRGHHDAVRGEGSYERVRSRTRHLVELGFPVALAMAVDGRNAHHMTDLVEEAAALGVSSVHYLWHFVRGCGVAVARAPVATLFAGLQSAHRVALERGVVIDNVTIAAAQAFALRGTRHDLSNAGWESLAIGPDDRVYPTAAMILEERAACSAPGDALAEVWRSSPLLWQLRRSSVAAGDFAREPLAYLSGGGDVDHSFFAGAAFAGHDPYRELTERLLLWLIATGAGPDPVPERAGLLARMGERVESCHESEQGVAFTHSNCVLSLPGQDGHTLVTRFYAEAALTPKADIANPVDYGVDGADVAPEAAIRSYGCGSPVLDAAPAAGEVVVDLGCGAGMECAIAARKVGPTGRVIGVDMLDEMLALARATADHAAAELGFDVVELRRGYLEAIPCADAAADVVISNCVVNLAVDKRRTFREVRRILKPGGRLVVSDIVADQEAPIAIRTSERLRGECLGGAMLQRELFELLEDCGFVGVTLLKRFAYREVGGHPFFSVTYRAERPTARHEEMVVYRGPFAAVVTDDGRVLRRGVVAHAAVPTAAPAEPLFVLDEHGGVANVDLGAGCACFVPPATAPVAPAVSAAPTPRITDREGCMVCGAELVYSATAGRSSCHYCGVEASSSAQCASGHFVCDRCHAADAVEVIRSICASSGELDMVALMEQIRAHPAVPIHGPEHHAMLPAVVVAAARNAGLPLGAEQLETAIERGRTIAGGACAFMGACGAATGVATGFSVILGATPLSPGRRQAMQLLAGRALARIASLEAARCCQRDCWLALQEASASSLELLGVHLPAAAPLPCRQLARNRDCLGAECPLWPHPRRAFAGTLPSA